MSTRRGKQFNSMVQQAVDPLTGAAREDMLISDDDMDAWAARGAAVGCDWRRHLRRTLQAAPKLRATWKCTGQRATCCPARRRPDSLEPDYNAVVTLEAADG